MELHPSTIEQVTALMNLPLVLNSLVAGAGWMVVSVWITILAAVSQAMPAVVLRLGVTFGHNGVFHLVQLPGLLCLLTGLQIGLGPKLEGESNATGMFPNALRLP
jgi:hypothetical protein